MSSTREILCTVQTGIAGDITKYVMSVSTQYTDEEISELVRKLGYTCARSIDCEEAYLHEVHTSWEAYKPIGAEYRLIMDEWGNYD